MKCAIFCILIVAIAMVAETLGEEVSTGCLEDNTCTKDCKYGQDKRGSCETFCKQQTDASKGKTTFHAVKCERDTKLKQYMCVCSTLTPEQYKKANKA